MSRSVWLAALGIVAAAVPAAICPAQAAETAATTPLQVGDDALAKFNLDAALASYREAQKLAPGDYEANWKLARALVDKGTLTKNRADQRKLYVESERFAREAVRLNPRGARGHTYLAIAVGKLALYEGGKRKVELSKEVKTEAEKAIELDANEDLAYHVLGVWNREMVELNFVLRKFAEFFYGKFPPASFENAVNNLRHATELAPAVVAHHAELGITFADMRKWPEAKTELDKALAMPKAWVTDEYYKDLAKQVLERTKRHVG